MKVLRTICGLALVFGLGLSPSFAQAPVLSGAMMPCNGGGTGNVTMCFKPPVAMLPLGFQQLSAFSTVQSLTVPAGASLAQIVCETVTVRWRDDGVAPSATVGMLLATSTMLVYAGKLTAFQVIPTASSATCDISYYR